MGNQKPGGPRNVAIIGPYTSGKTTLLESILFATGKIDRKGSVTGGNSVGDSAVEARARQMGVEVNVATTEYLGDSLTFLDCPGSVEFLQESLNVLVGVDAAILVCEPEPDKTIAMMPLFKYLEDAGVPAFIFVNKIDKASGLVRELHSALQEACGRPLVLRQVPILRNGIVTGYVDLASERSYVYKEGNASQIVDLPPEMAEEKGEHRFAMLEQLADFDDHLMEELLEDIEPSRDEVYEQLASDLERAVIYPVFLGSAEHDNGIHRLLKALRHEVPEASVAARRMGAPEDPACAQVLKNYMTQHGGKLSLVRVWSGSLKDGVTLNGERVGGMFRLFGNQQEKVPSAGAGEIVALGRLDGARTGDTLSEAGDIRLPRAPSLEPVYGLAINASNRNDEVKLSGALGKLLDEDPSLRLHHDPDVHQMILWGQGEMHLKVSFDRLASKHGISVDSERPRVAYKEAIRKPVKQHGRYKRQTGGHGQFGDVHLEIRPLPRGSGFVFEDKIVGGAVPRQFIPAVEAGVRDYLSRGPLGFPVVDLAVTLVDGQFHTVDSSEMSFKTAGRLAMSEGMPKCSPVLLEPIYKVEVASPQAATSKVNGILSSRRGQILGFDARPGWDGWDVVSAMLPQAELQDLIVELRSVTLGAGSFTMEFDHLQELSGRLADQAIEQQGVQAAT
ncbi:elongation factor G [Oceanibacterium hippocampi]|uniref:Elongation factor G n=1 Tax=Oceanibacterium hippocampi TaxID=745714 RepID=A0A1Y5U1R2_9PROT|nr:elongation factor G [Oceanibacterium hippocampi]SLN74334.1 Elongation factor G [Oceanibacterium hippocampi]